MTSTAYKIVSRQLLVRRLAKLRAGGKKIAFTNGCFDILHAGHVAYLEAAKSKQRVLVVGLNSDRSLRRIKGPDRPINGQRDRARVLAALSCVDFVVLFSAPTPYQLIAALEPDVLIKGADWRGQDIVGQDIVENSGGKVELIRFLKGRSTTRTIEKIKVGNSKR